MKRTASAIVLLLFVALPVLGQTPEQKEFTVAYVTKLQNKDGGFSPAEGQAKSSLGATNAALRALKYCSAELADKTTCIAFVKSCFDKASGGFADQPGGKPAVSSTAVGLMALVELKVDTEPFKAPALAYLNENAKTFEEVRIAVAGVEAVDPKARNQAWSDSVTMVRNEDGTFGKGDGQARDTGSAAVALLRLGGKVEKDAVLKALNAGQRKDGGFGKADTKESDLETCYRVMRAYHMLASKPNVVPLGVFIDCCRNKDGGYGVAPGKPSTASATYYAMTIYAWLSEK